MRIGFLVLAAGLTTGCGGKSNGTGDSSGSETGTSSTDSATGTAGSTTDSTAPPADPPPECELIATADELPLPELAPACDPYLHDRDIWTVPVRIHNQSAAAVVLYVGVDPQIESPDGSQHYPPDCSSDCDCEEFLVNASCPCIGPEKVALPRRIEPGGVTHTLWAGYLAGQVDLPDACAAGLSCTRYTRAQPGPHNLVVGRTSVEACMAETAKSCACTVTTDGSCLLDEETSPSFETIQVPFELGEPCDGVDVYID